MSDTAGPSAPAADVLAIERDLRRHVERWLPDERFEVRAFKPGDKGAAFSRTYLPDEEGIAAAVEDVERLNLDGANCYVGSNPVRSDFVDRPGQAVKAKDVTRRVHLILDVDSVREDREAPATREEAEAAIIGASTIVHFLHEEYCLPCVEPDCSGNGARVRYQVRLPNSLEATHLVRGVLYALEALYASGEGFEVDTATSDASRVTRIIGTTNWKPRATAERPNRRAEFLGPGPFDPDERVVEAEQLEALITDYLQPEREPEQPAGTEYTYADEDVNGRTDHVAAYILGAVRGECSKIEETVEGRRHRRLVFSAMAVGGYLGFGVVPRERMASDLLESARRAGLPSDEAEEAVAWGLTHGAMRPRRIPNRPKPRGPWEPEFGRPPTNKGDNARSEADPNDQAETPILVALTPGQLYATHKAMRRPVVDGLLRRTEIMNIIAAPKVGKSWLGLGLAMSVATGRKWLGRFDVIRGRVLIIDNELHAETISSRMRWVAEAMGLSVPDYQHWLAVLPLRGRLRSLVELGHYFQSISGQYALVILDSLYRFTMPGESENDNAATTARYNLLDRYAEVSGAAIAPIHHTSKGSQADKAVTDVGAGAGAQSRAADTHMILTGDPCLGPDRLLVDAAIRSFRPIEPFVIKGERPLWVADGDAPPPLANGKRKTVEPEQYALKYASSVPRTKKEIKAKAEADGLSVRDADSTLEAAITDGFLHPWKVPGEAHKRYATCKQPSESADSDEDP